METVRKQGEMIEDLTRERDEYRRQLAASNGRREDAREVIERAVERAGGPPGALHLAMDAKWVAEELNRIIDALDAHAVPPAPTAAARARWLATEWRKLKRQTGTLNNGD